MFFEHCTRRQTSKVTSSNNLGQGCISFVKTEQMLQNCSKRPTLNNLNQHGNSAGQSRNISSSKSSTQCRHSPALPKVRQRASIPPAHSSSDSSPFPRSSPELFLSLSSDSSLSCEREERMAVGVTSLSLSSDDEFFAFCTACSKKSFTEVP